ncbi:MAG: hypothetical protein COA78_11520 [Blastopirellula sp.]|nr:MAG: hypothetical protein COA78_11520 [Blastopirellula sp.]
MIVLFILGGTTTRIFILVFAAVVTILISYLNWVTTFRPNDRVIIKNGKHQGKIGAIARDHDSKNLESIRVVCLWQEEPSIQEFHELDIEKEFRFGIPRKHKSASNKSLE